jgi:DNA-binding GntR family transcriptional regulator
MIPSSREQSELLDVIEARDADAAEDLISRHIGHIPGICTNRDAERD